MLAKLCGMTGAILLAATSSPPCAHAQAAERDESSWRALTNEPSRGELLKRYVDELKAEGRDTTLFALPYSFRFAHDALFDESRTPRTGQVFGIDISHWEGNAFPFELLKEQSVAFVYTKATQGTDYADKTFARNWARLGSLPESRRIPRGAFHFMSSDRAMSGKAQADSFIDYVNKHGGFRPGDLRPALDLEWDVPCRSCPDRWRTRTPAEIIATTVDFLNQVQARTGRKPLVYTNKSFLKSNDIDSVEFIRLLPAGARIWIFDLDGRDRKLELPNPADNLRHVLWQFTFQGGLNSGFDRNFDVDLFKGTQTELEDVLINDN